jgi:hypothetical protein
MDLFEMIAELQAEKQRLDEAIAALEQLSLPKIRRRGRPTKSSEEEKHPQGGAGSEKFGKDDTRRRTEPEEKK